MRDAAYYEGRAEQTMELLESVLDTEREFGTMIASMREDANLITALALASYTFLAAADSQRATDLFAPRDHMPAPEIVGYYQTSSAERGVTSRGSITAEQLRTVPAEELAHPVPLPTPEHPWRYIVQNTHHGYVIIDSQQATNNVIHEAYGIRTHGYYGDFAMASSDRDILNRVWWETQGQEEYEASTQAVPDDAADQQETNLIPLRGHIADDDGWAPTW